MAWIIVENEQKLCKIWCERSYESMLLPAVLLRKEEEYIYVKIKVLLSTR